MSEQMVRAPRPFIRAFRALVRALSPRGASHAFAFAFDLREV